MGKSVKGVALEIMHQTDNLLMKRGVIRTRLDMRFNFDKQVMSYINSNRLSDAYVAEVLAKKRKRAENRSFKHTNVLNNPIVKDYMNNKHDVVLILPNRICFYGGRNHWAKSEQDLRILKLLIDFKNRRL